jgi:hypothetical protein
VDGRQIKLRLYIAETVVNPVGGREPRHNDYRHDRSTYYHPVLGDSDRYHRLNLKGIFGATIRTHSIVRVVLKGHADGCCNRIFGSVLCRCLSVFLGGRTSFDGRIWSLVST